PAHQCPAPGVQPAPRPPRTPLSPTALFEILDGFVDDLGVDVPDLVRIADEQAVVAERIDEPRNSARVLGDQLHRRIGEEPEVARPGDPEPGADVVAGLCWGEWEDAAAEADTLLELAQLGPIQLVQELGLTDKQDLQQFLRRGLEVREKSNLLERMEIEILRLVENEDGVLTGATALDQEVVQGDEPLDVGFPGLGH